MPIQRLERGDIRPTPLETGIKPLERLVRPSVIESQGSLERLAALALPISHISQIEHACHRMSRRRTSIKNEDQSSLQVSVPSTSEKGSQRLTSFSVAKRHTERIHRGSGGSRREKCATCRHRKDDCQCETNGAPKSQQFMPGVSPIGKLPSKQTRDLYRDT